MDAKVPLPKHAQPVPSIAGGPAPLCPNAALGCEGATLCRFAPPEMQRPCLRELSRGGRVALDPAGERTTFHAVRSGLVGLAAEGPGGRRQIVCLAGAGELLCPAVPGSPGCRVEALTESRVCEINLGASREVLERDPDFARQMLALAHGGLAHAAQRIVSLGRLEGRARLAAFLLDMGARLGTRDGCTIRLSLPMTREDIADCLGLNTETVSRLFTRLRREGLLTLPSPTAVTLTDAGALDAIATGTQA
mgnify:CR=1 FL=1